MKSKGSLIRSYLRAGGATAATGSELPVSRGPIFFSK